MLDELNWLVEDAATSMQTANEELPYFQKKELDNRLDQQSTSLENMEAMSSSHVQKPEVTEYGVMMGVVYIMLKQDCKMQKVKKNAKLIDHERVDELLQEVFVYALPKIFLMVMKTFENKVKPYTAVDLSLLGSEDGTIRIWGNRSFCADGIMAFLAYHL